MADITAHGRSLRQKARAIARFIAQDADLRTIYRRNVPIILGATLIIVGIFGLILVPSDHRPDLYSRVVSDWDDNIGRLGIEPVYPPQEDVLVGDLYFTIKKDNAIADASGASLAGRSVKVDHIDLSTEIQKYMKDVYLFPKTIDRPDSDTKVWRQGEYTSAMFGPERERNSLPLVLFPGISIARTRDASAALSGIFSNLASKLGWERSEQTSIDLKIPAAETYGVTSLVATSRLAQYCYQQKTRLNCSDQAVRNQLSMVAGDAIYEKVSGSGNWRYDVEIALVNRVYMTRAIDSVSDSRDSSSGEFVVAGSDTQASLLRKLESELQKVTATSQLKLNGAGGELDSAGQAEIEASIKVLATALATAHTAEGRKVVATQTFERPVVIGMRAVRTSPITSVEVKP